MVIMIQTVLLKEGKALSRFDYRGRITIETIGGRKMQAHCSCVHVVDGAFCVYSAGNLN